MLDAIYVAATVAFFAATIGLVFLVERLMPQKGGRS